jgi:hypothetical protein
MKKAIAMKCTQEQFDAVKDKLVGCTINSIDSFEEFEYLTNNYGNSPFKLISNISNLWKEDFEREVHETWNEEIFLNACGIEIERIFKGSELQYKVSDKWRDCHNGNLEYRLKPANLIKKQELESQILELQNQLKNL